jgi:hypothetical protein
LGLPDDKFWIQYLTHEKERDIRNWMYMKSDMTLILETKQIRNGPEQPTPDHCGLSGQADGLHARCVPNPLGCPRRNLEQPENGRSKGCERPAGRRMLWCPHVWD